MRHVDQRPRQPSRIRVLPRSPVAKIPPFACLRRWITAFGRAGFAGLARLTGCAGLVRLAGCAGLARLAGCAGLVRLAGCAGLALLAGCAGPEPGIVIAPPATLPSLTLNAVYTSDGADLPLRSFLPDGP